MSSKRLNREAAKKQEKKKKKSRVTGDDTMHRDSLTSSTQLRPWDMDEKKQARK